MINYLTIERYKCTCDKCGHVWVTKEYKLPRLCAKCKSPAWGAYEQQPPKEQQPERGAEELKHKPLVLDASELDF